MQRALLAVLVASALIATVPAGVAAAPEDPDPGQPGCQPGEYHLPEDQDCDGETDEQFGGSDDTVDRNGNGVPDSEECKQYRIPEDRNCDGQIDDEFVSGGDSSGDSFWDTVVETVSTLV